MPLNEFSQDLSEEGLAKYNGIIVMPLPESVDFSYLVFLEGRPGDERFVFVSEAAYEDPVRVSGSKSEKTRLDCKADLYAVCDPVIVWLRPGLNVCHKMMRSKGDSKMTGDEEKMMYQTRVVISPPEQDGWVRCYAEDFGEVEIRKEDQFRFRKCFPNVAYYANVGIDIHVSDLRSLDVLPTATAEYFLAAITDSPDNHLSAVVTSEVNPMLHTYRASDIQNTLCRLAPWNANVMLKDLKFYEDGSWIFVSDPNPSKRKEHISSRALIIDEDGRTAFCRRHPDNLVLLADVLRNNKFGIGQWIAAHFFYSPICKQWIAVSCGPETEYREVHEPIDTRVMKYEGTDEAFRAFKLVVCRSEVVVMKTNRGIVRCRYGGLVICTLLSVIDGDKQFWCVVADPDQFFASLKQDRATVWARFAGADQAAKFVIVGVDPEDAQQEPPTRLNGEGVYLGGDGRIVYAFDHPSCSVHAPALVSSTISPGDRVKFFAVWKNQLQVYVAIQVVKNAEDLPMKVLQTEHGPTIRLTAHRLSERAFYHSDLGLIADPQRKIKLKTRKLSKEELQDDRETFYIAIDHHVNATTYFKAISRKRPQELVQHAQGLAQADRTTPTDAAQKNRLVDELRRFGDALGRSPQGRRQLTAANLRNPWLDLLDNAEDLASLSS